MAGTKEGGRKAAAKNLANDPLFYKKIGAKGGSNPTPTGGFGSDKVGKDGLTGRQRAVVKGAVGGAISRRNKKAN